MELWSFQEDNVVTGGRLRGTRRTEFGLQLPQAGIRWARVIQYRLRHNDLLEAWGTGWAHCASQCWSHELLQKMTVTPKGNYQNFLSYQRIYCLYCFRHLKCHISVSNKEKKTPFFPVLKFLTSGKICICTRNSSHR